MIEWIEVHLRAFKQRIRNTRLADWSERRRNHITYEDVFLVSFPKSGNTWARFLITGLYLWLTEEGRSEPNYFNIHRYVPDIHLQRIGKGGWIDGLPRMIKSHRAYTRNYTRVIYVVRDVRDVMISRFKFINRKRRVFRSFDRFLRHPAYGARSWSRHVDSWLDSPTMDGGRMLLVRYEDLLDSAVADLRRVCEFLQLQVDDEALEWVERMGGKDRIRGMESRFGRARPAPVPFLRRGEKAQWLSELTPEQVGYIETMAGITMDRCGYERSGAPTSPDAVPPPVSTHR